jgi:hypothetical protein
LAASASRRDDRAISISNSCETPPLFAKQMNFDGTDRTASRNTYGGPRGGRRRDLRQVDGEFFMGIAQSVFSARVCCRADGMRD